MNKDLIKIIDLVAKKLPEVKELKLWSIILVPRKDWKDRYMTYIKDIVAVNPQASIWYYWYKMLFKDKLFDVEDEILDDSEIIGQIQYQDLLRYLWNNYLINWVWQLYELYNDNNFEFISCFNLSKSFMEQSDEVYKELLEFLISLNKK